MRKKISKKTKKIIIGILVAVGSYVAAVGIVTGKQIGRAHV